MKPNTIVLGWPNSWRKKEDDSRRVFVDTIRNAAAAKMALLVPKGIQRYPDSGDKVIFQNCTLLKTNLKRKNIFFFKRCESKRT